MLLKLVTFGKEATIFKVSLILVMFILEFLIDIIHVISWSNTIFHNWWQCWSHLLLFKEHNDITLFNGKVVAPWDRKILKEHNALLCWGTPTKQVILPLVQNKMSVTKACADYEVSFGIDVGMIFRWHCRSILSSLNMPNFSFHANKRKNCFFSDQQLSPYRHFIVDQREYSISVLLILQQLLTCFWHLNLTY